MDCWNCWTTPRDTKMISLPRTRLCSWVKIKQRNNSKNSFSSSSINILNNKEFTEKINEVSFAGFWQLTITYSVYYHILFTESWKVFVCPLLDDIEEHVWVLVIVSHTIAHNSRVDHETYSQPCYSLHSLLSATLFSLELQTKTTNYVVKCGLIDPTMSSTTQS